MSQGATLPLPPHGTGFFFALAPRKASKIANEVHIHHRNAPMAILWVQPGHEEDAEVVDGWGDFSGV